MEFSVIVAPRAVDDLRDLVAFVSPDRPEAARRLAAALLERTKPLRHFPFSGRVVPEFDDPSIRELILHPYRIVYRVDETRRTIGVARFWHGARSALQEGDLPGSDKPA